MGRKVEGVSSRKKKLQPALVFEETIQAGEALRADSSIWTSRMLSALVMGVQGGKWFSLCDKTFSRKSLESAFARVKANDGAPGPDGWTVSRFDSQAAENLERLHESLMAGTYRPGAIRRVWIPKPGTREKRPLGIPSVRDRVAQTALRAALDPIFEKEFRDCSFGFRPGRSCKQALRRVWTHMKAGKGFVVDADLKRFFDTIPHKVILDGLEEKVSDGKLLGLVRSYLEQGVMEDGVLMPEQADEVGTPQGSPLSPLLANIALHGLDTLVEDSGYAIVRYADDFVILCETREQADLALETVRTWTDAHGLSLHPEKTRIVDTVSGESFEFLGFLFRDGRVFPRKKSKANLRDKVRAKTPRQSGRSLLATIKDLNRILKGWYRYFRDCPPGCFNEQDSFVRRRLRAMLDRRNDKDPAHRGATNQRWTNAYFEERGLFSMAKAAKKQSVL